MKKSSRMLGSMMILCVIFVFVGFFLSTALIPIQDIDMLTKAELIQFQKEVALNYLMGKFMIYCGTAGIILCLLVFLYKRMKH